MLKKTEKEKLMELIEAKKNRKLHKPASKADAYGANGEARKGVKKYRKGGLFDK